MQCKIPLRARARASTGTEFVSLALAEVKRLELTANLKVKSASIPMRGAQDAVSEWRASGERVASERPTSDQRATDERIPMGGAKTLAKAKHRPRMSDGRHIN